MMNGILLFYNLFETIIQLNQVYNMFNSLLSFPQCNIKKDAV